MSLSPTLQVFSARMLYLLAVAAPLAWMLFYDWRLVTPRDMGGTLMGGMFGTLLHLSRWTACALGLLLALLLRLPFARSAWLLAGLAPLAMALGWQLNYPDDANGNLLFSPSPGELETLMLLAAAITAGSLCLLYRGWLKPRPTGRPRQLLAVLLIVLFGALPVWHLSQPALPECAFDAAGRQLTVCIGEPEPSGTQP